jgi:urea transport system permease protein
LFALGALFVLVTIYLPKGIVGTWSEWRERMKAIAASSHASPVATGPLRQAESVATSKVSSKQ